MTLSLFGLMRSTCYFRKKKNSQDNIFWCLVRREYVRKKEGAREKDYGTDFERVNECLRFVSNNLGMSNRSICLCELLVCGGLRISMLKIISMQEGMLKESKLYCLFRLDCCSYNELQKSEMVS